MSEKLRQQLEQMISETEHPVSMGYCRCESLDEHLRVTHEILMIRLNLKDLLRILDNAVKEIESGVVSKYDEVIHLGHVKQALGYGEEGK